MVCRGTFFPHLETFHLLPACWNVGDYTANLQSNMYRDKKIITTRFISLAVLLMLRDQSLALKSCSERLKDRSMSTNWEWQLDSRGMSRAPGSESHIVMSGWYGFIS